MKNITYLILAIICLWGFKSQAQQATVVTVTANNNGTVTFAAPTGYEATAGNMSELNDTIHSLYDLFGTFIVRGDDGYNITGSGSQYLYIEIYNYIYDGLMGDYESWHVGDPMYSGGSGSEPGDNMSLAIGGSGVGCLKIGGCEVDNENYRY